MFEPEFLSLAVLMTGIIFIGTLFYRYEEGWSYIDSLYFAVITLSTVGYGEIYPTTPASKLFTIFFILFGVGIIFAFFAQLADKMRKGRR